MKKTKIKRQVKEKDTRKVMTRETSNEKNSREGKKKTPNHNNKTPSTP